MADELTELQFSTLRNLVPEGSDIFAPENTGDPRLETVRAIMKRLEAFGYVREVMRPGYLHPVWQATEEGREYVRSGERGQNSGD